MKISARPILIALTAVIYGLGSLRTWADDITVENPSFEALAGPSYVASQPAHFSNSGLLLPGHYSVLSGLGSTVNGFGISDPIPGWKVNSGAGTINYNTTPYFQNGVGSTDGQNVAWLNRLGSINQTLGATYQVGVTYELKVDVSSLIGIASPGFKLGFFANGVEVATAVNSVTITPGVYSTVTVDASIAADSAFVGQPISLQLGSPTPGAANSQVLFDNVRVTSAATTVPEPSTWVLTGIGFVALATMGRARSSSIARRDS